MVSPILKGKDVVCGSFKVPTPYHLLLPCTHTATPLVTSCKRPKSKCLIAEMIHLVFNWDKSRFSTEFIFIAVPGTDCQMCKMTCFKTQEQLSLCEKCQSSSFIKQWQWFLPSRITYKLNRIINLKATDLSGTTQQWIILSPHPSTGLETFPSFREWTLVLFP